MADSAVKALQALLSSGSIDDDNQALKTANAAINATKSKPSSPELLAAQHTKIVALLKLDRFDDALRAIADAGSDIESRCALEHAYALYKTGELQAAAELCKKNDKSEDASRGLRHVAAQVDYRLEAFASAAQTYEQLRAEADDDETVENEENDLRINTLATNAQLSWQGRGSLVSPEDRQPAREDLEAFETAYNAGCLCLAQGDIAKASVLLKRAKDLVDATDLSDEDKGSELLPIIVQQAYILTRQGKLDAAAELYKSVEAENVDGSTKAIIQNNSLLAKDEKNPFITQRRFETVAAPTTGNSRPFDYQANTLRRNKYIIELQCQKFEGVASSTLKRLKKSKDTRSAATSRSTIDLGALNAAATASLASGRDALKRILPLLDSRPDDVGLLLTIIQLYVQARNPFPAITLLEAFFKRLEAATTPNTADVRFAPGLVAVAVALYKLAGRHNAVRAELAKASAHWQSSSESLSSASLLRQAGIELLASSRPADHAAAGAAFSHLASTSPSDRVATAGLVASFATSDWDKVEPHLASLTPIEKLTSGKDAASLISAGVAALPAPAAQPTSSKKRKREEGEATDGKAQQQQPAKRRRSKRKLPKDYDPDKKMDPERWLPLRDRSSWRPKGGKKGKKRAADTTQGGIVKDEETLELAGGAGSVKVEKTGGGGGGGKGKKKKGKK